MRYSLPVNSTQLLVVVMVALSCYFAIKFVHAVNETREVDERAARVVQEIQGLEAENRRLQERLKEVQSDDYVEREARDKLGLVRPGDVPFVVRYSAGQATATPAPALSRR